MRPPGDVRRRDSHCRDSQYPARMSDTVSRFAVFAGIALLILGFLTWMVGSGLNRPMSFRLTVAPVVLGVILVFAGILRWAVAA